jgi:hypothetical protein
MRRFSFRFVLIGAVLVFAALPGETRAQNAELPAGAPHGASISPATFVDELHQLDKRLGSKNISSEQIAAVRVSIPSSWEVDSSERHYSISSQPLISMLRIAQNDPKIRSEQINASRAWLSDLRQQVEEYSAKSGDEAPSARTKAKEILSRREFAGVGAADPRAMLQRRISEWLARLFTWLFERIGRHPIATETFFWLIVAGVVAWLAMMLFRYWMRGAKLESIEKIGTVTFRRPWQEWIRAAREAAARGDFREAIHSTYWAGIVRLETIGALAPDPSRTPRESLSVLANPLADDATSANAQQRESLAALTVCLERVWYGHRSAGADDFQDCLRRAEELGCRVS